jgi:hypothetical protein
MSTRILYPRTVTICLQSADRAGEWMSLIRLQVAKSNEPRFFACLVFFCVVVHPTLNPGVATLVQNGQVSFFRFVTKR